MDASPIEGPCPPRKADGLRGRAAITIWRLSVMLHETPTRPSYTEPEEPVKDLPEVVGRTTHRSV